MGRRRQAREIAFKALFQIDMGQMDPQDALDYLLVDYKGSAEVCDYARELTLGVVKELHAIDQMLSRQAHHWELSRLAGVDRNILRLAVFELLRSPGVPKNVIINEAIEIAKKYSTEESGRFINGILDQLPFLSEKG